jgi:ribonuclease HI
MNILPQHVDIFTDGSCHSQKHVGAWVSLFQLENKKTILQGVVMNTSHQRMELTAVLEALLFFKEQPVVPTLCVVTDSQYVVGLIRREANLKVSNFKSKAGKPIANADLLVQFYDVLAGLNVTFVKVKAHQPNAGVPCGNREVDYLVRKLVRKAVSEIN